MSNQAPKYLLIALPNSITSSGDQEEALHSLQNTVKEDYGTTSQFKVPSFKVGNLDSLLQQADDLAKLCSDCEAVTNKIGDSLSGILEGDKDKIAEQKVINDKPVDTYLQSFQWNKVKYRIDRPIPDLAEGLKKELVGLDSDVRNKFSQYNATKNNLAQAQRNQTGNLSTKSLASVINPESLINDSEYLETHLIAVPRQQVKEFYKKYESLCDMVVPRSAMEIESDKEFTLFAVATFQKTSSDFLNKAREQKWIPRDYRYKEHTQEDEQNEMDDLQKKERKLWGEALRLGRTGYSEAAMIWMHVFAIRIFVESILRYGLPPAFVAGIIKTTQKQAQKAKGTLDATYMYLGGNAVSRDKRGRITKDDSGMQSEMQAAGHGEGSDYTPYVYYEFELN